MITTNQLIHVWDISRYEATGIRVVRYEGRVDGDSFREIEHGACNCLEEIEKWKISEQKMKWADCLICLLSAGKLAKSSKLPKGQFKLAIGESDEGSKIQLFWANPIACCCSRNNVSICFNTLAIPKPQNPSRVGELGEQGPLIVQSQIKSIWDASGWLEQLANETVGARKHAYASGWLQQLAKETQ